MSVELRLALQERRSEDLARRVRRLLGPFTGNEAALDAGCGTGALAFSLAPNVAEVVGAGHEGVEEHGRRRGRAVHVDAIARSDDRDRLRGRDQAHQPRSAARPGDTRRLPDLLWLMVTLPSGRSSTMSWGDPTCRMDAAYGPLGPDAATTSRRQLGA